MNKKEEDQEAALKRSICSLVKEVARVSFMYGWTSGKGISDLGAITTEEELRQAAELHSDTILETVQI